MSPKEAMEAVQAAAKVGWSEVEAWVGWKVERWTNGIKWSHLSELALCHGSFLQDENTKLCQISLKHIWNTKSVKTCQISQFFSLQISFWQSFRNSQQWPPGVGFGPWRLAQKDADGAHHRGRNAWGTCNKRHIYTYLTFHIFHIQRQIPHDKDLFGFF